MPNKIDVWTFKNTATRAWERYRRVHLVIMVEVAE